jgi:hypothetical protein
MSSVSDAPHESSASSVAREAPNSGHRASRQWAIYGVVVIVFVVVSVVSSRLVGSTTRSLDPTRVTLEQLSFVHPADVIRGVHAGRDIAVTMTGPAGMLVHWRATDGAVSISSGHVTLSGGASVTFEVRTAHTTPDSELRIDVNGVAAPLQAWMVR